MKSELIVPQLVVRASSLRDLASHPGARTR
jgi:hypothetical protein